MIFQVLTQFPERYRAYLEMGLPARAYRKALFHINTFQLRDFANARRKGRVDDAPYGGGPGMLLQVEPVAKALEAMPHRLPVVLFTPRGMRLKQKEVQAFAQKITGYTLICGYFEGVDERIAEHLADHSISLGDFILGSGDLPALCFIEAVTRLLPGYTGSPASLNEESMQEDSLEYPQYTRPADYRGWKVPEVLLSGDHQAIALWRKQESRRITHLRRKSMCERKDEGRELPPALDSRKASQVIEEIERR